MRDIPKIIKTFLSSNDKIYFGEDDLVTVNPQTSLCILAKGSAGIFEQKFGTHDSKNFLEALGMFEECELLFKGPYLVIKDAKKKSKQLKYKIADEDVMAKIIEKNEDALELFAGVTEALTSESFVKIKLTDNDINEFIKVSRSYKLDTVEFKYEGGDKINVTIKNLATKASEFDDVIDIVEGSTAAFECIIDAKYLIGGDWDVYFIEDRPFIFLENDEFKIAIVHSD
jgi:hypothetical protein